jgi:hypothetical protein
MKTTKPVWTSGLIFASVWYYCTSSGSYFARRHKRKATWLAEIRKRASRKDQSSTGKLANQVLLHVARTIGQKRKQKESSQIKTTNQDWIITSKDHKKEKKKVGIDQNDNFLHTGVRTCFFKTKTAKPYILCAPAVYCINSKRYFNFTSGCQ